MQALEVQLISSLIKSLVTTTDEYEMIFKSLIRLPQTQIITNYFFTYFSKTQEIDTKKKIILIYFRYVDSKKEQIANLSGSLLFDQFKHLICDTPPFDSIDEYIQFSSTLTFYIQNLKTFSDSSLYQSIIDWSNDNTPIALFSLSEIHSSIFGRCLSAIILNFNQKMPTIISISLLLLNHKFESIDQTAQNFFNEQNVTTTITDTIQYCFNDETNQSNENKKLGFFLLRSILHFLRETDSRQFYVNLSDTIFSIFDKCDDTIQNVALKAFCELPPLFDDNSVSVTQRLSTVISAFGQRITDFNSDLANQLIEFTDKRIKSSEKAKSIEPLFSSKEQFNGAALLACRYDLVGEFVNFIFPEEVTDSSQALSACYSIEYLCAHEKITDEVSSNALKTFISASSLAPCSQDEELEKKISSAFEILFERMTFEKVVTTVFDCILHLLNSEMIDKIIDIFMKFCKENSSSFSSVQKVTDDEFVERLFPYLMKFSISNVESQRYISYLFVLIFCNAMKTGVLKAICELIDAPLSLVFERLIPSDCSQHIYSKALEIFDTTEETNKNEKESTDNETKLDDLNNMNLNANEVKSASSLIIISLKGVNDTEVQTNVAKSFISKDSFNDILFERFIASITYVNSDQSIEFLESIVMSNENESTSITSFFLRKSPFLKSFFTQSTEISGKFSKQTIINTLSYVSILKMSSSSLSKLFSIFFTVYEQTPKSRALLLSLTKHHQKCELSDKFVQFVISSEYFVEVIPHFFYEIDQLNESILQKAFKTYFDYGDQNKFEYFCRSAFVNYPKIDSTENSCFSILASSLLSVRDVYKMMKFGICLCKYDCENSIHVPKLTIQFAMNILSNDDMLRDLCQTALFCLYLLKTHRKDNTNEAEFNQQSFKSSVQITSLPFNESVLKCIHFFNEITSTELFSTHVNEIIKLICIINPIELPIMLLCHSICSKHFETQEFALYLSKQGSVNSNNALIKRLANECMSMMIDNDFSKFMNFFVSSNLTNQFILDFFTREVKSSEKHHNSILKFAFTQFLTNMNTFLTETDVKSGKFQLFLCLSKSNPSDEKSDAPSEFVKSCRKDDFLLIWLACIIFVNMNRSSKKIALIVRRDCRLGIGEALRAVFARLGFECPAIEERDMALAEAFSKKIAQFVFQLSLDDVETFVESLKEVDLKNGAYSDISIVVVFVVADLLKLFLQIQKEDSENNNNNNKESNNNDNDNQNNNSSMNNDNYNANKNDNSNESSSSQNNSNNNNNQNANNNNQNNDSENNSNKSSSANISAAINKSQSNESFSVDAATASRVSSLISVLADTVHSLCSSLKDDACRVVSAKFASLFTVANLRHFSDSGKRSLLLVSLRSLVTPDESTQNSCIIFLSMILAVSPPDSIVASKAKLLDAITRCFDLKQIVGIEVLLDSIQSIVAVDGEVQPFDNMGLISIPWFLILSVSENSNVRRKSCSILKKLSCDRKSSTFSEDDGGCYGEIVDGFFEKLGADEMSVFGNFIVDWSAKNGFNRFSMRLIEKIAVAIKKCDEKLTEKFLKKTVPALMPIVNDSNDSLQSAAIEILSVLME